MVAPERCTRSVPRTRRTTVSTSVLRTRLKRRGQRLKLSTEPSAEMARLSGPHPAQRPVLVGIPAVDWLWTESAEAIYNLQLPPGSRIVLCRDGASIAYKRNQLVALLLAKQQFSHLLFLDSDMRP